MKQGSVVVRWFGVLALALLMLGAMLHFQSAQAQEGEERAQVPPPGAPAPPGRPDFPPSPPGFPEFFEGRGPMRPPMMMGGTAIAAQGEFVYVVQGNALYQFAARDLRLVKRVILEPFPPPRFEGQLRRGEEGERERRREERERRREGERERGEGAR